MDTPRPGLDVGRIVDAACATIRDDGLQRLSMRRLGARLGVDPMAVYHHVANKQALLALVMSQVVAAMPLPDGEAPWGDRVRQWAGAYWEVVAANRELVAAGLADPVIAGGGMPIVAPLRAAVADSGISADLVEPNVYLVVDFVHGSALGSAEPLRRGPDQLEVRDDVESHQDLDLLRAAFERGLDTVLAGLETIAEREERA